MDMCRPLCLGLLSNLQFEVSRASLFSRRSEPFSIERGRARDEARVAAACLSSDWQFSVECVIVRGQTSNQDNREGRNTGILLSMLLLIPLVCVGIGGCAKSGSVAADSVRAASETAAARALIGGKPGLSKPVAGDVAGEVAWIDSRGKELIRQQKYADAEVCYRQACQMAPKNAIYREVLGELLVAQNKTAAADPYFREAVQLDGDNGQFNNMLGVHLWHMGKYAESEGYLRKAVHLQSQVAKYQADLGGILLAQGKDAEAESWLRQTIRLEPSNASGNYHLAILLFLRLRLSDAEPYARKAVLVEPDYAEYTNFLGVVLYFRHKYVEAKRYLRKAVELDPSNPFFEKDLYSLHLDQAQMDLVRHR